MRPEILAPAGSMEALKAAVHAGADAVYLGGNKFGARAYANNFDESALIEAIEYCHLYGVKVYLTINTLFRNEEMKEIVEYLTPLYLAGVDAVIVQDFGVMRYIHCVFPDLPIHASTQMTITTKYAYMLLKEYGVTRIVPARELSVEEIASLKAGEMKPEVEVFVQGALCYCYSGQCLMSSMLGGRSGNRGRCAQTCRLPYSLYDIDGNPMKTNGEYLLSPKDLCGLESIPDLIRAGVDSFKIEGRMKRPEYVAVCVRAYRNLLDAWYQGTFSDQLVNHYKAEMAEVFNRGGFTEGYYNQKNGKHMMSTVNPGNVGVRIGNIISIHKNQISIQLEKDIYKGDLLFPLGAKDNIHLTSNVDGRSGQTITLNVPKPQQFWKGQWINRISNKILMDELQTYSVEELPVRLRGNLQLIPGEQAIFTLHMQQKDQDVTSVYYGDMVDVAASKPLTMDTVRDKVGKTGNTRYVFDELEVVIGENAFYSLKALKDLRRNAIAQLQQIIVDKSRRNKDGIYIENSCAVLEKQTNHIVENTVMVSSEEQYEIVKQYDCFDSIYLDVQYFSTDRIKQCLKDKYSKLAIALPPILRLRYQRELEELIAYVQQQHPDVGIVIRNIDELAMLKQLAFNGCVIADYSLYTMNDWAAAFVKAVFENIKLTVPVELNEHQMKTLDYISDNTEMIVYGYQPLMISSQCLQETTAFCNHQNVRFVMKDRYLKNFFIFSVCKYCYNLIYNGIPTVLYDVVERDFSNKLSKRLHFTKENPEEVKEVIEAFIQGDIPKVEKTRGHYKRGVE